MNRAYSVLQVKQFDDDQRIIQGVATTPAVDRQGDSIDPLGVRIAGQLPLLWQHQHSAPIGTVKFDKPTSSGVTFTAKIAKVSEPGTLKDRVDEAWQSVKAGLITAVSVGFRPLENGMERLKGGGTRFTAVEILELSLVTVGANPEALIGLVKAHDEASRRPRIVHRVVRL